MKDLIFSYVDKNGVATSSSLAATIRSQAVDSEHLIFKGVIFDTVYQRRAGEGWMRKVVMKVVREGDEKEIKVDYSYRYHDKNGLMDGYAVYILSRDISYCNRPNLLDDIREKIGLDATFIKYVRDNPRPAT